MGWFDGLETDALEVLLKGAQAQKRLNMTQQRMDALEMDNAIKTLTTMYDTEQLDPDVAFSPSVEAMMDRAEGVLESLEMSGFNANPGQLALLNEYKVQKQNYSSFIAASDKVGKLLSVDNIFAGWSNTNTSMAINDYRNMNITQDPEELTRFVKHLEGKWEAKGYNSMVEMLTSEKSDIQAIRQALLADADYQMTQDGRIVSNSLKFKFPNQKIKISIDGNEQELSSIELWNAVDKYNDMLEIGVFALQNDNIISDKEAPYILSGNIAAFHETRKQQITSLEAENRTYDQQALTIERLIASVNEAWNRVDREEGALFDVDPGVQSYINEYNAQNGTSIGGGTAPTYQEIISELTQEKYMIQDNQGATHKALYGWTGLSRWKTPDLTTQPWHTSHPDHELWNEWQGSYKSDSSWNDFLENPDYYRNLEPEPNQNNIINKLPKNLSISINEDEYITENEASQIISKDEHNQIVETITVENGINRHVDQLINQIFPSVIESQDYFGRKVVPLNSLISDMATNVGVSEYVTSTDPELYLFQSQKTKLANYPYRKNFNNPSINPDLLTQTEDNNTILKGVDVYLENDSRTYNIIDVQDGSYTLKEKDGTVKKKVSNANSLYLNADHIHRNIYANARNTIESSFIDPYIQHLNRQIGPDSNDSVRPKISITDGDRKGDVVIVDKIEIKKNTPMFDDATHNDSNKINSYVFHGTDGSSWEWSPQIADRDFVVIDSSFPTMSASKIYGGGPHKIADPYNKYRFQHDIVSGGDEFGGAYRTDGSERTGHRSAHKHEGRNAGGPYGNPPIPTQHRLPLPTDPNASQGNYGEIRDTRLITHNRVFRGDNHHDYNYQIWQDGKWVEVGGKKHGGTGHGYAWTSYNPKSIDRRGLYVPTAGEPIIDRWGEDWWMRYQSNSSVFDLNNMMWVPLEEYNILRQGEPIK